MTSATGGYLLPVVSPDSDAGLARILHGLICGITGLSGSVVRPLWQENPPPIPSSGTTWAAFGLTDITSGLPYMVQVDNPPDTICEYRQDERFTLRVSVYGPSCQRYAAMIRDGVNISQNREAIYLHGISVIGTGNITRAPELVNDVWLDRCDIEIDMGRVIIVNYDVLNFLAADGEIDTDMPMIIPWHAGNPAGIFDLTFDETFG